MRAQTAASWSQAKVCHTGPNFCSVCGPTAMMASSRSSLILPSLASTRVSVVLSCFAAPPRLCSKCYRQWVGSMLKTKGGII
ncbi:MAG: hypothetical protein E6J21_14690 [Chloroflexota bacterium]|nr:MAG: hypothetical protein E6J21_14690 [Chloroflexota bacterium]